MKNLFFGVIALVIILFLLLLTVELDTDEASQPTVLVLAPYDSVKVSDLRCETQDKSPLFLLNSIVLADSLDS